MAERVDAQPTAAPEGAAASDGNDLETLHPERSVRIAGQEVTVRRYGFIEGLRLRAVYAPIAEALSARMAAHGVPDYEQIADILAENADAVIVLVATAAGLNEASVRALDAEDGDLLLLTWWGVNGSFFVSAVARRLAMRAWSAGARSTPHSSLTDTATPTDSADTPRTS